MMSALNAIASLIALMLSLFFYFYYGDAVQAIYWLLMSYFVAGTAR